MSQFLKCLILVVVCFSCRFVVAQNSAPSSHMVFDDRFPGDIVINEVRVPKSGRAMYTYYEALGWRGKAAGYAGIQVHPKAPNFIFSIWDHKEHRAPIRAEYHGPGTKTERFGGEGTGLKSWNFELGWKTDVWYTLVARSWAAGDNSKFAYWSRAGDTKVWTHLVTMDVAVKGASFEGATDAFIEDWLNTGVHARTTNLRDGWKRKLDGSWFPFGSGRYSVNYWDLDPGKRSYNYRKNWDGGTAKDATGDFYFMTAGGKETQSTAKNPSQHKIARKESRPAFKALQMNSATAVVDGGKLEVNWETVATTAPQFSYELIVWGQDARLHEVKNAVIPHARQHSIDLTQLSAPPTRVELRCSDIFAQQSDWKKITVK